jgi:uncharacterized protein YbjT (DUF2867 family)
MIAITGATGNTGSVVAETLLARGEKVRVIGRDAGRLARFATKGAEAFVADITDAGALGKAFEDATGLYAMIPPTTGVPDFRAYQNRVADSLAAAIKQAAVPHVVALSSFGADKAEKTGFVVGLHNFEQKLNAISNLNAIYLRAGYFLENLFAQVGVIKNFGFAGGPLRPDLRLPMIATRDIGAHAAELLAQLNFKGKQARELLGQRDVSYKDATSAIGQAIGKPDLAYQQLSPEQLGPGLLQMGFTENTAGLLLDMADALNTGHMKALEPRSEANTTRTTIEKFVADEFLPRFRGKSATV